MRHRNGEALNLAEVSDQGLEPTLKSVAGNSSEIAAEVRRIIKARRDRGRFFPRHLFADPAWDMLLELYAAELEQVRISVSKLCDASDVPATTALRWISTLVNESLVKRHSDPFDARRIFVTLSSKGLRSIRAYCQTNLCK